MVEEADRTVPAVEAVGDRLADLASGRQLGMLLAQPDPERLYRKPRPISSAIPKARDGASRKLLRMRLNAAGRSSIEKCPAAGMIAKELLLMPLVRISDSRGGVMRSSSPTITKVCTLI